MKEKDPISAEARELLKRFRDGQCSPEEERRVLMWFHSFDDSDDLKWDENQYRDLLAKTKGKILTATAGRKEKRLLNPFFRYAAAAVLIVSGVVFLLYRHQERATANAPFASIVPDTSGNFKNDILSGGYHATLRYGDGKSRTFTGLVPSNELYESATSEQLTLDVPRTGMYQLELEDGTLVWLNAESSLEYPMRFGALDRKVTLRGEAFFDVKKDPDRPFKVEVGGCVVEALGTSFNVQAYDGIVSASLATGSIRVSNPHGTATLVPGDEAVLDEGEIAVRRTDLKKKTAWKAGEFYFKNDQITTIMAQLARWYQLDVRYDGDPLLHNDRYSGVINRDARLSAVLTMLNKVSGIDFEINERTVDVKF